MTDILELNIGGTSYALAGESGKSTITGGCKGLHWEKKDKKQLTTPLELSQAIALEIYDRRIAIGATENTNQQPKNDGTVTCTFMCLEISEKSLELQPVSDDKIANTFFLTFLLTFSQFFR